jgi:hypothetical protein
MMGAPTRNGTGGKSQMTSAKIAQYGNTVAVVIQRRRESIGFAGDVEHDELIPTRTTGSARTSNVCRGS